MFDKGTGKHIASFYLDPYSRPADKRGGAWMDVCIGKSKAVNRDRAKYATISAGMTYDFDGKKYRLASAHQKEWGVRLIDELALRGHERILDLGSRQLS